MTDPTGRRLEVLALLHAHRDITASRLAARLAVTERTVRRDVAYLRELGYRIDAEPGRAGGYRLAPGTTMPPLVLNADEALALAVGLRTTVSVGGLGSAAVTALDKLTETVPSRLRARLEAVAATESSVSYHPRAADRAVFVALALAWRANEAVRFRTHPFATGAPDRPRDAQPHRMILLRGRWYLVACEPGASRWCIFAVDRIIEVQPLGTRFRVPSPPDDATTFAVEFLARGSWQDRVRVRIFTSIDLVRQMVDPTFGDLRDDGEDCILTLGTDDLDWAARWLVHLNLDFDVIEPPELARRLHILGRWLVERYPSAAHEN